MNRKIKIIIIITSLIVGLILGYFIGKYWNPGYEVYSLDFDIAGWTKQMLNTHAQTWELGVLTTVIPQKYSNASGDTITYYYCRTAYGRVVPQFIEGVHLDAITCVIDPATADSSYASAVNDLEAVLYCKGDYTYLCWTLSPEMSCVLQYNPEQIAYDEIIRMAESVSKQ